MRKILAFCLFVPSFSLASFFPAISWTSQGAQPTTSTSTILAPTSVTTVTPGTGTFTVNGSGVTQPISSVGTNIMTVTPGTGTYTVSGTVTSNAGTGNFQTYTTNLTTVTFSGVGAQPFTSTYTVITTTYTLTFNTNEEGVVSSITLPSPKADASTGTVTIDSSGRTITADIPFELISTTASANMSAGTTEIVLISSATMPKRTLLCGCIFMNNSATNTGFTLYQSTSSVATNPFYVIGAPANYVPSGIRTDCGHPFFASAQGGAITIKPSASATSTLMNCQYFQK